MSEQRIPGDKTLKNIAKLAVTEDRPIMLDYYIPSLAVSE